MEQFEVLAELVDQQCLNTDLVDQQWPVLADLVDRAQAQLLLEAQVKVVELERANNTMHHK